MTESSEQNTTDIVKAFRKAGEILKQFGSMITTHHNLMCSWGAWLDAVLRKRGCLVRVRKEMYGYTIYRDKHLYDDTADAVEVVYDGSIAGLLKKASVQPRVSDEWYHEESGMLKEIGPWIQFVLAEPNDDVVFMRRDNGELYGLIETGKVRCSVTLAGNAERPSLENLYGELRHFVPGKDGE